MTDWKVGDRVVIQPLFTCENCYACSEGMINGCAKLGTHGFHGRGGGLSNYVVTQAKQLYRLPDNVSFEYGAMVEPLCVAMHGVKKANFKAGQTALVSGAGPIGCFVVACLVAKGAK